MRPADPTAPAFPYTLHVVAKTDDSGVVLCGISLGSGDWGRAFKAQTKLKRCTVL